MLHISPEFSLFTIIIILCDNVHSLNSELSEEKSSAGGLGDFTWQNQDLDSFGAFHKQMMAVSGNHTIVPPGAGISVLSRHLGTVYLCREEKVKEQAPWEREKLAEKSRKASGGGV